LANVKQPFDEIKKITLTSATQDVEIFRVDPGWIHCIQRVAFRNATTATSVALLYKKFGGKSWYLKKFSTSTAGVPDTDPDSFYATENQVVGVEMITANISDVVEVIVSGWKQRVGAMAL